MDPNLPQQFSVLSNELCNLLYAKSYNKDQVNSLIDDLNSKPFKGERFVRKHEASLLISTLCLKIKPADESLAAKTSHLINSIIYKQNIQFESDFVWKVVSWHIDCLRQCSDIILPDILHNLQCIIQSNPQSNHKYSAELIGPKGVLLTLINPERNTLSTQNPLQVCYYALKCVICMIAADESKVIENVLPQEVKESVSQVIIQLLMKGYFKNYDEFLYCKVVISALRVLSQLYFNDQNVHVPLPEVIGICRFFILYGIVNVGTKPEKIMPAQQTVAFTPVVQNTKGGKVLVLEIAGLETSFWRLFVPYISPQRFAKLYRSTVSK